MICTFESKIKIIVSVSENDAIGKNGALLFRLKDDMENFKNLTTDNIVIMGRKTYESIGKALPNRINIVITSDVKKYKNEENLFFADSLDNAIEIAKKYTFNKHIFIIGGGQIYEQALDMGIVDEIILTRVKKRIDDADTFFPRLDYFNEWKIEDVKTINEGYNMSYDIVNIVKKI